jgi:hypothetical protein
MGPEPLAEKLSRLEGESDRLSDRLTGEVRAGKPRAEMIADLVRLRLLVDEIAALRRIADPELDGSEFE